MSHIVLVNSKRRLSSNFLSHISWFWVIMDYGQRMKKTMGEQYWMRKKERTKTTENCFALLSINGKLHCEHKNLQMHFRRVLSVSVSLSIYHHRWLVVWWSYCCHFFLYVSTTTCRYHIFFRFLLIFFKKFDCHLSPLLT